MCGLVAMIAKTAGGFAAKDKVMFSQMLYADALRGFDSTGAFSVNKYNNLNMLKSAQPASSFVSTKAYEEFLSKAYLNGKVLVGHNRAATKGEKTDINAHPFIEGNTCLVHNGTLHSHKHLKDVTVDSHAITHSIDERGWAETYQDLYGAFALIWYDAEKKRLNIVRNNERPLWILETDQVDYIASEPDMLTWLYERNYGKSEKYPTKYFTTESLYYYDMEDLKEGFNEEALPEKKAKPAAVPAIMAAKTYTSYHTTTSTTIKKVGNGQIAGYNYDDKIIFALDSYKNSGVSLSIVGEAKDSNKTRVCSTIPMLTDEDEYFSLDLLDADILEGKVSGVSWKAGVPTVLLSGIKPAKLITSCNGVVFTEEEFYEDVCICSECGSFIDPDVEDELFWVRHKNGKTKASKCVKCVAKDPHLKKLIGEVDVALL